MYRLQHLNPHASSFFEHYEILLGELKTHLYSFYSPSSRLLLALTCKRENKQWRDERAKQTQEEKTGKLHLLRQLIREHSNRLVERLLLSPLFHYILYPDGDFAFTMTESTNESSVNIIGDIRKHVNKVHRSLADAILIEAVCSFNKQLITWMRTSGIISSYMRLSCPGLAKLTYSIRQTLPLEWLTFTNDLTLLQNDSNSVDFKKALFELMIRYHCWSADEVFMFIGNHNVIMDHDQLISFFRMAAQGKNISMVTHIWNEYMRHDAAKCRRLGVALAIYDRQRSIGTQVLTVEWIQKEILSFGPNSDIELYLKSIMTKLKSELKQ
jgi:hypothetical protein